MRQHDYFITGTDTEIGKTFVTSALLQAFSQQGISSLGLKPIASGAELRDGIWHNEDVDSLMQASSVKRSQSEVCPYLMQTPAAPHIVAARENVRLDPQVIVQAYQQATMHADAVMVEGVGGFHVPLLDDLSTADLAQQLNLPVILVVGMRLGCINHALLTAEAIAARGLRLAGWVANTVDTAMLFQAENIEALQKRIHVPMLGHIPRLHDAAPLAWAKAGACLDLNLLK
ncbi:dethiobiotin synthase [Undibacterium sp. LFS511W]|uniref:ATP-dependent dethiobiotin synthetase BioD n=2 Tax=Undibacterium luofuense TaxID=2828733 RepID=A0A941I656_9BURK|nr:dethiobiotin synthase [Undibacterium luofuense]